MTTIHDLEINADIDRRMHDALSGMVKLLELHRSMRGDSRAKMHVAISDITLLLEKLAPLTKHEGQWERMHRQIKELSEHV